MTRDRGGHACSSVNLCSEWPLFQVNEYYDVPLHLSICVNDTLNGLCYTNVSDNTPAQEK